MFGWWRNRESKLVPPPEWPKGESEFGTGRINLGEIEVAMVKDFKYVGTHTRTMGRPSISFFSPVSIPDGFFPISYLVQEVANNQQQPKRGSYVLVARDVSSSTSRRRHPPITFPLFYMWHRSQSGSLLWIPRPANGYMYLSLVPTCKMDEGYSLPSKQRVMCVRGDLLENSLKATGTLDNSSDDFKIFNTNTANQLQGRMFTKSAVPVATFFDRPPVPCHPGHQLCLKNLNPNPHNAMPNLEQLEALIHFYGPIVYFHPDEVYFPSSVPWYFNNGGRFFFKGSDKSNDGDFTMDSSPENDHLKHGDLSSAQLYIHVRPAFGGTFTDIDMWIFFPFKGADIISLGWLMNKEVEASHHVACWEHFTLRVNNFDGQLWSMYFSGSDQWVEASNLDFYEGTNKPIVYSAKGVHATLPNAGTQVKGWTKLGTGVKYKGGSSRWFINASERYQIISAVHLGQGVVQEPSWLPYMQEYLGSTSMHVNDGDSELKNITRYLSDIIPPMVNDLFSSGTSQPTVGKNDHLLLNRRWD